MASNLGGKMVPKITKKRCQKRTCLQTRFFHVFFNFLGFLNPNFDGFFINFWTRSANVDFVKIVLPPAREHDF